jgi:hypothetical protein
MRVPTRQRTSSAPAGGSTGSPAPHPPADGTARTAGWSGVLFAGLLVTALVLVHRIPTLGASAAEYNAFYGGDGADTLTVLGLYVVPFAGIACLWHMLATRTLVQVRRPLSWTQVQHWLQLAACIVFVCMLFAGTAAVGAVALLTRFSDAPLPGPDVARALSSLGYALVFVYGVRAAGMYMLTTTGLARKAGLLPRPVVAVSYLAATFLLLSTTFHPAILLVFPAWVLMVSIVLLVHRPLETGAVHDHDPRAR